MLKISFHLDETFVTVLTSPSNPYPSDIIFIFWEAGRASASILGACRLCLIRAAGITPMGKPVDPAFIRWGAVESGVSSLEQRELALHLGSNIPYGDTFLSAAPFVFFFSLLLNWTMNNFLRI